MKTLIIGIVLLSVLGHPLRAAGPQNDWRAFAERIDPGAYLVVRLTDGSKVTGTFVGVSGDQLGIRPRTRAAVPPRQIPFGDIRDIDTRRPGMNPALKFLAITGVVAGAAVLMFFNAVLNGTS